ncbi:hypothetical protein [Halobacteriovorax sp. CON-3]|uniref:hypothetical protein n=1 Tax=Halobacteriovorax sp. CON-3 TaxID=3157710 RepID=UPI0037171023
MFIVTAISCSAVHAESNCERMREILDEEDFTRVSFNDDCSKATIHYKNFLFDRLYFSKFERSGPSELRKSCNKLGSKSVSHQDIDKMSKEVVTVMFGFSYEYDKLELNRLDDLLFPNVETVSYDIDHEAKNSVTYTAAELDEEANMVIFESREGNEHGYIRAEFNLVLDVSGFNPNHKRGVRFKTSILGYCLLTDNGDLVPRLNKSIDSTRLDNRLKKLFKIERVVSLGS